MNSSNLLSAGVTVQIANDTWYKLAGTLIIVFLAFFVLRRVFS